MTINRMVVLHNLVKRIIFPALLIMITSCAVKALPVKGTAEENKLLEGRWDLNIMVNGKAQPSWLEVRHSGFSTLIGAFVGSGGSARPISKINFDKGHMSFSIPPQWEVGNDMMMAGTLKDDALGGTVLMPNGKSYEWTGVRAPTLRRDKDPVWGQPAPLFNGKDLTGWHTTGANQWVVENGVLKSPRSGSNLISDQKFNDFKLHVEFKYPAESNSGVYLRGRYEVQIEDSKGLEPLIDYFSSIYGFIAPTEMTAKAAGEWQMYDITLVGRNVTVVSNGKPVITNAPIAGITGGALDSNEGEPGPIFFQGDHGPIEYRNIVITLPK